MADKIAQWIAWHLPRRVAYWCAVRVSVHATTGKYSQQVVPNLHVVDALQRWNEQ